MAMEASSAAAALAGMHRHGGEADPASLPPHAFYSVAPQGYHDPRVAMSWHHAPHPSHAMHQGAYMHPQQQYPHHAAYGVPPGAAYQHPPQAAPLPPPASAPAPSSSSRVSAAAVIAASGSEGRQPRYAAQPSAAADADASRRPHPASPALASSEMLSLIDSRNVDVRIRSIVAMAEQEAAAKLQDAHPDEDEDPSSTRRRKSPTDRASRRRELNRVNAKKSRLRKKFFIEALILRVARLEKEAERLRGRAAGDGPGTGSDGSAATLSTVSAGFGGGQSASRGAPASVASVPADGADRPSPDTGEGHTTPAAAAAAAAAASSTGPRAVPAAALSPRLRDALVAAGPDRDLVRLLEATGQAFCIADPGTDGMPLAYVSPGFEALTGFAAADAIGRNCRFLQGPGTDRAATARMGAALREGRGCCEVLLNYRKDGAPFWNRVLLAPLRDSTGAVRSYVSVQACVSRSLASLAEAQAASSAGAAREPKPAPSGAAASAPWVPGAPPLRPTASIAPPRLGVTGGAPDSRASLHGAALSDSDAAALIRSLGEGGPSPAKRARESDEAAQAEASPAKASRS